MDTVSVEIKRRIGELSSLKGGWKRELNIVSWNGGEPKYDIRNWDSTHERPSRGITLTNDEAKALYFLLKEEFDK